VYTKPPGSVQLRWFQLCADACVCIHY